MAGARHPGATGGWYLDTVSWQGGGEMGGDVEEGEGSL